MRMTISEGLTAAFFVVSGIILASLIVVGLVSQWSAWRNSPPETVAPAVKQVDGSTVLERAPDAKAKPKQQIPKGAKVERLIGITLQPGMKLPGMQHDNCPPVTVDLSLVRMPDATRRVIASSPDGEVLSGLDVPVESALPPPEPKRWAAGVSLNPARQTVGLWIDRDIARVRVGAEINQTRDFGLAGIEARVKAGMAF